MSKDSKDCLITFLASENDKLLISEKMKLADISNMSAYLRKMAIDGYIINLNIPELDELLALVKRTSANINQIAKRVNATGNIYDEDIREILKKQDEIRESVGNLITKVSSFR